MAHAPKRPSLPQLHGLLTAAERTLLDAARNEADATAVPLWLVGGAVRDLALGRDVHDLDLALPADAGSFAAHVVARLDEDARPHATVESEARFGTASIRLALPGHPEARLDLARLRTEHYVAPGALPQVAFVAEVEADLARRDFTVNAMALGLAGGPAGSIADTLADPHGGLDDLAARRLRVIHDRSFEDDATRLWRGARTAALFDLAPDQATARLISEGLPHLDTISGERISAELRFTARRGRSGRTLALAEAWGVLRGTHPALRLDAATTRALRRRTGPLPFEVFMALLLAPLAERTAVLNRLTASRAVAAAVEDTARLIETGARGTAAPETLERLAGASAAARTAARWLDPERQPALQRDLRRWERTRPALDAAALMRLGVPAGPPLGLALDRLRRARYLGTLRTRAEAQRQVRRMIAAGDGAEW
jgi:tRNA nucleotidyltransferase (CCA-adding enzyme)